MEPTDDQIEILRREQLIEVNTSPVPDGPTWTTDQLAEDFEVEGFLAPYVVVRRKSDGTRGTLLFKHMPRLYFDFRADR